MDKIIRGRRARREAAAIAAAREKETAAYIVAVLDGQPPDEVPEWMAPALALWVQHATAEVYVRAGGMDPADAMERARVIIARTAGEDVTN